MVCYLVFASKMRVTYPDDQYLYLMSVCQVVNSTVQFKGDKDSIIRCIKQLKMTNNVEPAVTGVILFSIYIYISCCGKNSRFAAL